MVFIHNNDAAVVHSSSSTTTTTTVASAACSSSLAVHRVRFVNWSPSTVTALAVSPTWTSSERGILAVGRQNGNVELCTWIGPRVAQKSEISDRSFQSDAAGWAVHTVLPGQVNSKIEQLCFLNPPTRDPSQEYKLRLFSISGGSIVTEHFLPLHLAKAGARRANRSDQEGRHESKPGSLSSLFGKKSDSPLDPHYLGETRTLPSLAGAIWSMAPSATGRYLALGCEDGSVRIVDLEDDRFEHLASTSGQERKIVPRFSKAKGKIISLCWGPPVRAVKSRKGSKRERQSDAAASSPQANQPDSDGSSEDSESEEGDDDDDDADVDDWHESFLVGGLALSSAVVWDASTGTVVSKLAVQKSRTESTIVWSVATLPDGTIVIGDSTGRVTFFDAQTRTPIPEASFRAHAAASDVLALCVGPDGRTIYSAGVDQKVAEYTRIDTSSGRGRWIHIASRRLHAHDIRALALDPPYSPLSSAQAIASVSDSTPTGRLPVLISGGVDFNLVLTPAAPPAEVTKAQGSSALSKIPKARAKLKQATLNKYEQEHASINPISSNPLTTFADTTQRRVPFVPTASRAGLLGGGSVAALCPSKGWIVLRREQSIGIWDLGDSEDLLEIARANHAGEPAPSPSWAKLLEMEVKVDSNLVCVVISHDGCYLAFSDLYETKLFELKERRRPHAAVEIEPRRVKGFGRAFGGGERIAPSASALRFSPDSTRLVVCSLTGAYVHVLELPSGGNGESCKLLRSFGHHRRAAATSTPNGGQRHLAGRSKASDVDGDHAGNGDANGAASAGATWSHGQEREERTSSAVVQHAEISYDGAWLSTISSDLQHHIFSLDSLTYGRTLPSPSSLPTGSVFHPSTSARFSSMLTLVFADNKVEFWDVESGKELVTSSSSTTTTTPSQRGGGEDGHERPGQRKRRAAHDDDSTPSRWPWEPSSNSNSNSNSAAAESRASLLDNLTKLKHAVQTRLASVRDFAISAVWLGDGSSQLSNYTLVLYGATWICTAQPASLAKPPAPTDPHLAGGKKSAPPTTHPKDASVACAVRTTAKFQPLLLVAHVPVHLSSQPHLLIVERPYFELARNLTPAFHRAERYGT